MSSEPASSPAGVSAAVAAVTAWGMGNVLIAWVPMNGLAVAFWRLLAGSLIYLPILYLRGGRISATSVRAGWKGGVAFGLNVATFFVAIRMTTVANAVTISALQPLVIMGFAVLMFGERVRLRHVVSALVAVGGVALVTFGAASGGTGSLSGDLVAGLALFTWAAYFIASKAARTTLDTFEYMTVLNIVAFLVVAPIALLSGSLTATDGALTPQRLVLILGIVLIPGSGHILMNWAHGHTTLLLTSLLTLGIPVLSTIMAALFLDQSVVALQMSGIVIVLAALTVVILGDSRAATPPTEATP